jgi:hypothetical protein
MPLKLVIAKLEDVDEASRALYKMGGDGKYHLDTEEDEATKAKIKEFRDNNVKLMKEKEELEKKLKDIGDPAEIEKMKKKIQAIDDKQMIEAGKIDELVAQKVERMKADYENQLSVMKQALEKKDLELLKINDRLSEVLIDSEITRAVNAVGGVRKEALQDLIARGKRVWKLEDGKPIPKEGDKILYGKDGKSILTFDEWAQIQHETAPFLFEPSSGSGASGAGAGNKGAVKPEKEAIAKMPPQERLKHIHGAQTNR